MIFLAFQEKEITSKLKIEMYQQRIQGRWRFANFALISSLSYTSMWLIGHGCTGNDAMNKSLVLAIFSRSGKFLTPDYACNQLRPAPDRRSFYSYLARLQKQGLLERHPNSRRGHLAYRLTARGQARLEYFRRSGRG